jgi:putative oxidoreductase
MTISKTANLVSWALQIVVAIILAQTLFFKFTGAEESKYIFTTLLGEQEAAGRIGSGLVELAAAILILWPRAAWLGALIAAGTMAGAIFSHLTRLGVEVKGDGGLLFALALVVLAASAGVLVLRRREIPVISAFLTPAREAR